MEAVKFLPFEGRGTIRRMVEGPVGLGGKLGDRTGPDGP